MSNQATLLQYQVVLDWAREIVSDIDSGASKFRVTNDNGEASDAMFDIREQQLRVIEILDDLVADNHDLMPEQLYPDPTEPTRQCVSLA